MNRVLYIIMAGGRGERLRPLTDDVPKPLVRFGPSGRIIDFTLYNCLSSGFGDVLVLTQYRSDMLERYVNEVWRPAYEAQWRTIEVMPSDRSPKGSFMGTADAVYQALLVKKDVPWNVVVLAGDHVYRMDYRSMVRFHQSHQATATVGSVMCERDQAHRFGIIQTGQAARIESFHEKPKSLEGIVPRGKRPLASMGIYVFTAEKLMRFLEFAQEVDRHDFGHDVVPKMAEEGEAYTFSFQKGDGRSGYWRDVGDLRSYWQTHMELLDGRCHELFFDAVPGLKRPPFSMANLVRKQVSGPRRVLRSLISESAIVGAAEIRDSVICRGAYVEDGAEVERSVVLDGAVVRRGARLLSVVVEPEVEVRAELEAWAPAAGNLIAIESIRGLHPMGPIEPAMPGHFIKSSENNPLPA